MLRLVREAQQAGTDGLNFPSNDYMYHGLDRQGARVVTVPSPDGMTLPVELVLDAIDEETQLVSVSQVAFRSSYPAGCRGNRRAGTSSWRDGDRGPVPVGGNGTGECSRTATWTSRRAGR